MKNNIFASLLGLALVTVFIPSLAAAGESTGGVDSTNKYAWGENVGWIDFGSTAGSVVINDEGLSGYAWGENVGWISLSCSNTSSCETVDYKVTNTNTGDLGGYAWGENIGWVDFSGVSIGTDGSFSGYAYGENVGWISFNCADGSSCGTVDFKVSTDWRPLSQRQETLAAASAAAAPRPATSSSRRASNMASLASVPVTQPTVTTPTPTPTPVVVPPTVLSACADMEIGFVGSCARSLQVFLNAQGFTVSRTGAGSVGLETTTFGPATRSALIAFQKAKGISPQAGYFGPRTKAVVRVLGN